MKARIIYHDLQDFRCLVHGDPAELKHYYDVATLDFPDGSDSEETLEILFKVFNTGDRCGLHVRSMTVGDKVQFIRGVGADERRETWICRPVGWTMK